MSTEQTTSTGRQLRGDRLAEIRILRPDQRGQEPQPRNGPRDQLRNAAVLSIEEAAEFLRIGRTCAYELARRYEATGGADGLPVIRVGRLLRVPRAALMRMIAVE